MCYWFIVSLIAWGALSLIGIYWRPLHAPSSAACLFAMAIGCLAMAQKSLFSLRVIHVNVLLLWRFVLIGIGIAFLLEWRYAKRSAS